jgi:hypothetical protein
VPSLLASQGNRTSLPARLAYTLSSKHPRLLLSSRFPTASTTFNMASGVDAKLLKSTKFPPEYSKKVDMQKVNLEVMKQ